MSKTKAVRGQEDKGTMKSPCYRESMLGCMQNRRGFSKVCALSNSLSAYDTKSYILGLWLNQPQFVIMHNAECTKLFMVESFPFS